MITAGIIVVVGLVIAAVIWIKIKVINDNT